MNYIKVNNYDELSKRAANIIAAQVIMKPCSVLGLATGSSPLRTYEKLAQKCKQLCLGLKLDTYRGVTAEAFKALLIQLASEIILRIAVELTQRALEKRLHQKTFGVIVLEMIREKVNDHTLVRHIAHYP